MTPIRRAVARPVVVAWVTPGLGMAALAVTVLVALVSLGNLIATFVTFGLGYIAALAITMREPHADTVMGHFIIVGLDAFGLHIPGHPRFSTRSEWPTNGPLYVP